MFVIHATRIRRSASRHKIYHPTVARLTYVNQTTGDARRQTDSCKVNALGGPNRRIRTIRRLHTPFIIAGDLHRSGDAFVVGREPTLFIPVAIPVTKMRQLPDACDAVCHRGEEPPELVKRAHI
jgi:hypothetical protein